ncbi:hypothetical protein DPMN_065033 [Dreissena polymorpha]|uniref:Uncharacterized protein n=1 Tax=Dreissena polymorpha TaxID=45954 RepID=A0A9D4CDC1_DREPO|nr:hypothetical protein DPMN_065033 [Dreissena polymorpha]
MMDVPNIVSEKVNKTALKRKRKSSLWLHQPKKTKFREENLPATVPSTSTSKSDSEAALYSRNLGHILQNRNHAFDSPTRLGKRQRKSKRSDISRPHEVARSCLPIRSHHKCDESKILPTTRLGITLEDTMKV